MLVFMLVHVTQHPYSSSYNMPSKKKKKQANKKAAGKRGVIKVAENAAAEQHQMGAFLESEMQRLRIDKKQAGNDYDDEVEAMLDEAIKLAAVEKQEMKQEMKVKEKENCTHGYNPSSRFQARYCGNYLKTFMESYHSTITLRGDDGLYARANAANAAFTAAITTSISTTNVSRNFSNAACVNPFCLAEGTKFILVGKSDDARLSALLALLAKSAEAAELPDRQKILELLDGDEHTLVQFFRKQIPCSCLDEKHKEVKSVTKMGICFNDDSCPLPGNMAVRSKMLRCTGCRNVNYCSRECQEANWPMHKKYCGLTTQEIAEKIFAK
jgi:hypothetical protein